MGNVVGKAVLSDSDGKAEGEEVSNIVREAVGEEVFLLVFGDAVGNVVGGGVPGNSDGKAGG